MPTQGCLHVVACEEEEDAELAGSLNSLAKVRKRTSTLLGAFLSWNTIGKYDVDKIWNLFIFCKGNMSAAVFCCFEKSFTALICLIVPIACEAAALPNFVNWIQHRADCTKISLTVCYNDQKDV